jgi:hypothetical protein
MIQCQSDFTIFPLLWKYIGLFYCQAKAGGGQSRCIILHQPHPFDMAQDSLPLKRGKSPPSIVPALSRNQGRKDYGGRPKFILNINPYQDMINSESNILSPKPESLVYLDYSLCHHFVKTH